MNPTMNAMMDPIIAHQKFRKKLLKFTMNWVGPGNAEPNCLNISLKVGITKIMRIATTPKATHNTMMGYVIAPLTLFFRASFFSMYTARRFSTVSSTPPTSPAATRFT